MRTTARAPESSNLLVNAPGRPGRAHLEVNVRYALATVLLVLILAVPAAADPVATALRGLSVRPAITHGNLTLFPLVGATGGTAAHRTLGRAIEQGLVEVREKDDGVVNRVLVRNNSGDHVFGLAGEIITGAKQNRMLERDVLLPPKSDWLELAVYCVEQGRWHGSTARFEGGGQIAAGRVRGRAANARSQSAVWDEISANKTDLGLAAPTTRFDAVYEDETVQEQIKEYRARLESRIPTLAPGAVGVAVAVGDRLVCVDLFGSPAMFRSLWPRLLESYVIDALAHKPSGTTDAASVRAMLDTAASAPRVAVPTVGAGRSWRIEGTTITGSALVRGKEIVHLDLFPAETSNPAPPELDFRRRHSR